ncbi:hypothetical protein WR25_10444 [Diploscapter pachys]|uniref:Uncharacterized protein n=1 Tax=Diploscapter pachys TaxID=2018661 RepID=A0A2A2K8Q2_9BILA|nr:hypothetical protein WR25_10444 [Diploscapter pachys]
MQAILEQHETQANAAAEQAQVDKLVEAEKRFIAGERAKTGACTASSCLWALCNTSIRQSSSSKRSCNRPPSLASFSAKRSVSLHSPFSQ